jgi:hypothetical protein
MLLQVLLMNTFIPVRAWTVMGLSGLILTAAGCNSNSGAPEAKRGESTSYDAGTSAPGADGGTTAPHADSGSVTPGRDSGPSTRRDSGNPGNPSSDASIEAGEASPSNPVGDAGLAGLPLGTLTVTAPSVTCTGNPGTGATCMSVSVSCPGAPDIAATIAVVEPAGGAPSGTIVGHAGGAGTGYFNGGPEGKGFAEAYTAKNFRFVEIAWANDWASGVGSIRTAACRPATAFHWMYENIHGGSRTAGFCGTGTSGGSAALTYSLATYGLKSEWDYMLVGAGPAPSRIDYGCDPSLYTGSPRNLCPTLTDAPFDYTTGVTSIADGWEGTSTCGKPSPSSANIAKWKADSVAAPGGDFAYPQTGMSWWFCLTTPNETTGQGSFLIDQVEPLGGPADVHCYGGSSSPSVCQNEYVFADPNAFSAAVDEMTTKCVPNH